MDHIVVDVEIQKCIGQDGLTWEDTDKFGVACAVVYEYVRDRFRIYGPQDVLALQARLHGAERITTFNGWRFDFPVIFGMRGRERPLSLEPKSNDLLRRIWIAIGLDPDSWSPKHAGWSLNTVVVGTLGKGISKIGHGADAPKWYEDGQLARLHTYCLDDVTLERDLSDFVDRHGYVINGNTDKQVYL